MKRTKISPSDLTWSFKSSYACHRCLWFKYNHDIRTPSTLPPLFSDLAEKQEMAYLGKSYPEAGIPGWGQVVEQGGLLESAPLPINSKNSWYISGKFDLLGLNDAGTWAILDCKLQGALKDKSKLYAPQFWGYQYALEHPSTGEPRQVARLGLLAWTPEGVMGDIAANKFGMKMRAVYFPVIGSEKKFLELIQEFVNVMEGDMPPSNRSCEICNYIEARKAAHVA